ncbi:MAG: transposase [Candidatus Omnitrophica bacterium]|nr:transposase [Candidatus Omnitrophota bacterium]
MQIQRRKSIRLKNYDYRQEGAYYITVCTFEKIEIFGHIMDGKMVLNDIGKIVYDEWKNTEKLRPNVLLDAFIVMPNHIHGIIIMNWSMSDDTIKNDVPNKFRSPSQTIGSIVRGFKSVSTKRINIYRNSPSRYVWQRNFHDHIIRNEKDFNRIREYINNNPKQWDYDQYH